MQERKSLLPMKQLLDHTVEVLALCDHQLPNLLGQSLQTDLRISLKTMLFRGDLILSGGHTLGVDLIHSSIHRYLSDDVAITESISEKLRQVCPSLCRNEDALCTKVNKQLPKPRTASQTDRDRLLQQTLDTWKQIPARINLAHVCQQLAACKYYGSVVELCCCVVAEKLDSHHHAQQCFSGQQEDPASLEALLARKNWYQQMCRLAATLHGGRLSPAVAQRPQIARPDGPVFYQTAD